MTDAGPTLRDLIKKALVRHETKSINHLAKIGRDAGYSITQTTLSQIHSETYRSEPKAPTLEAIAYLAGVPFVTAHRAAGLGEPGIPFRPAPGADRLTRKQRDVVNSVIRALLEVGEAAQEPSNDSGIERSNNHPNVESHSSDTVAYVTNDDYRNTDESPETGESS